MDLYISGSSSQDETLKTVLSKRICDRGTGVGSTTDTFNLYNGPSGSNQFMIFCRTKGVEDLTDGTKVLFHKSSVGGSGNGVQPVANSIPLLTFMTHASTCPTVSPGGTASCSIMQTTLAVPDFGVADLGLYNGIGPFRSYFGESQAEADKMTVQSRNAVPFGVLVTVGLRNALQEAQCLTVGAEDEANMPSFTKSQLAAMFAGNLVNWPAILDEEGHPLTTARDTCANGSARTAPADSNVYIARRVKSSGTQRAGEIFFLNGHCVTNAPLMAPANDGGTCGNGTVNEGSGTSNVKTCLNTHNTANRWAVGIMSLENVSNLTSDKWRFIKIDGYAGTALNIVESRYPFFMEQSLQWRKATSGNALANGAAAHQKKLSITEWISGTELIPGRFGQPVGSLVSTLCSTHSWGTSCVMALATNTEGYVATVPTPGTRRAEADVTANPVMTSAKSLGGFTDNCAFPQTVFSTHATFESDNGAGNTPAH
jgi:hypothetical protein